MPRHALPKSLKNVAFDCIIKNIDNFWGARYLEDWGDKHLAFVEGPFDCLRPVDCHWILSELAMRRILKRHHIYLLISPFMKILNLSDFRDASKIKLILQLALTRCQNLKKIVLKFSQDFSTLFLPNLDILTKLSELELPNTRLVNEDVGLIGMHAPNLKLLNLTNTRFDDHGLRCLFMPLDPSGETDNAYGKCQKVEYLDIRGVEVSPQCVADVYIQLQSNWRMFRVDQTFDVIMKLMEHPDADVDSFKTDYVSHIPIDSETMSLDMYVQAALVLAPNASNIHLYELDEKEDSHGESLAMFQKFPKISELTLDIRKDFRPNRFQDDPVSSKIFLQGLCPILHNHGENLTFIMLTYVRELDLGLLSNYCTNLEQLRLQFNTYVRNAKSPAIRHDWPLKNLVIQCCSQTEPAASRWPEESVLRRILSSAHNLESLVFSYCNSFTDDVLVQAFDLNPFIKLTTLMITSCRYITMRALESTLLMSRHIPLAYILFFGCDQITLVDYTRYKRYIESNHFKVQVQWQ